MKPTWDEIFDRLMQHEGGYVNHPSDPGGETMWGVTKRVAVANGYTGAMRNMPKSLAKQIAYKDYWLKSGCDHYDPAIAYQVIDAAYNHGVGQSIKFLQRAVGVADDGIAGSATRAAVKAKLVADVVMLFNAHRLEFYANLGTWPTFGRGWARRVAGNLRHGAADVSTIEDEVRR